MICILISLGLLICWTFNQVSRGVNCAETRDQDRICKTCNTAETQNTDKLKPTIKLNAKKIPLQVKRSTTAVKVISMTEKDAVKSWRGSNKKVVAVTSKVKITGKEKGIAKITLTITKAAFPLR